MLALLQSELNDARAREVAAVFEKQDITMELLEGMSAPAWEALRQEANLTIGVVERIKRAAAATHAVEVRIAKRAPPSPKTSVPAGAWGGLRLWARCVRASNGLELLN